MIQPGAVTVIIAENHADCNGKIDGYREVGGKNLFVILTKIAKKLFHFVDNSDIIKIII